MERAWYPEASLHEETRSWFGIVKRTAFDERQLRRVQLLQLHFSTAGGSRHICTGARRFREFNGAVMP
jgi:hypothetical protein